MLDADDIKCQLLQLIINTCTLVFVYVFGWFNGGSFKHPGTILGCKLL